MAQSFLQFLAEARAHPDQNPKVAVNQAIATYADIHYEPTYVSMTNVDKLGINPKSGFDTPIGLYAYPTDYVLKLISGGKSLAQLPYGGDAAYANLFTFSGNVVQLDALSQSDADRYYAQIKQLWTKLTGSKAVAQIDKIIAQAPTKAKPPGVVGAEFWYVTWAVSELIAKKLKRNQVVMWSKLFQLLGIDGLLDRAGIIRPKEPVQVVFFTMDGVDDVERVLNKWSPESVERGVQRGGRAVEVKRMVAALSNQQIVELFKSGELGGTDINFVPPDARVAVLSVLPLLITHIDRLTDQEQAVAIAGNPNVIADLDGRGSLTSNGALGALKLVGEDKARTIVSDVSRTTALNPGSTFVASEQLLHAMVDLDLHTLRIIANKNKQKIPKSVIQHALEKAGSEVPAWLHNYAIKYNLK